MQHLLSKIWQKITGYVERFPRWTEDSAGYEHNVVFASTNPNVYDFFFSRSAIHLYFFPLDKIFKTIYIVGEICFDFNITENCVELTNIVVCILYGNCIFNFDVINSIQASFNKFVFFSKLKKPIILNNALFYVF